jgi:hypothetical protein
MSADAVLCCAKVWMDDVESLTRKYEMAKRMGLRGVGMWTADFLNYTQPISNQTERMWHALKIVIADETKTGGERVNGGGQWPLEMA